MKVEYIGPHDEVEVPSLNLIAAKGKAVEVPADKAEGLLSQNDSWRKADSPKSAKKTEESK